MKNIGILKFFMALVIACLFMTCDPGLGKAVDTQAPKVEVKYPATKSVLKGGFTMTGVASDEVNVASCEVTFSLIKNPEIKYHFNATVADDEFSVAINNPKADGSFEIPDGDYNVTVTVSDAYRNSTTDVVYTIDNTAPTVLLTSPNSYSESNWPNMYKTFNIKGEVYDATTIQTVTVYLVDENGTILKEVIADGTNTFLANFEEPFPEEKLCFYYAVAKDAGGNVNTYCYHKSDIFKLLSETNTPDKAESATKSITFPSINSIGYVDQGQSSNVTELIDEAKLTAIRINNNAPKKQEQIVGDVKKEVIVFPGFNYFAKDTAQVRWLNISKESLSGIAIGSPVLATIMPPTDGSAIDYSSVKVKISKSIDGTIENFEDFANIKAYDACVISEGEVGDKRVKLTAVGESLNVQTDSHPPEDEHDNWLSGFYKIEISFSTDSGNMASDSCRFKVSSGAPKLTEGVFAEGKENASYYRGYITSKTAKKALGGKSLSSDGNLAVELKWDVVGLTLDGKDKKDSGYAELSENGNYEIPIEVDVENHTTDGEYTYTLTAAPNSTLSTVISRVVVIDTLNPVVEFSNLANDDILENDEFIVKGNIDDANGISKVEYQLNENGGSSEWKEISNAKSSFNLQLSSLKENVTYTLKIRATDVAGNISGDDDYKCNFTIDLANPIATIDNSQPETGSSIYFTNEIPVFVGKASDDSKTAGKLAKTAILSYSKDGVAKGNIPAGTTEGQFNWNQESGTWTWTPTSSQFNGTGKYDVTLKVTDNAGKSTTVTRTVSLDTSVPTIKLTQVNSYVDKENPEDGYFVNGEISVKFDITENDYIKSIAWYKVDGTKDSQDLGTNAQPTVKIQTTDFEDGTKLGQFKLVVTDRSGNEGVYTGAELSNYEINQDSDNPTIDIAGIDKEVSTENEITAEKNLLSTGDNLSITFTDDDGIKSATYQIDNGTVQNIVGGDAKVKTQTVPLSTLEQRSHTIKVTVTDSYGKINSTDTIYFGIDDKAPDLTIDGYSGTDIDAGFKNTDFNITGTASDSYEFKQLIWNYVDLNTTNEITRNGTNWTLQIKKPNSSEKKTIRFVASDKFSRTTIKTFTYIFDLDKPNLIINDVQKENITDKYFNQNSILTLSGTANDLVGDTATQSGLKFVQYAIGTGHNATSANSDGWQNANGSTDWTVLLNIPKYQDGQYTLLVKALDNSDNESEVQKFNITADSVSPILTEGGSSDASGTSYASGTLNLTGTVTEKNLNSLIYTYSLDGQEKESNDVQIPPNNGDEVSWSITKSELQDGTHVFKIIATDKAGNSSVITRNIIVDKTSPVITTNVSPQIMYDNGNGEELTVNGEINVSVRVAETNKLKGVYYTFKDSATLSNDADWSGELSFNDEELSAGKTILINTLDYNDGEKLPLRIKAIDEAGNFSIEVINPVINQESDKPIFDPSNFESIEKAGWEGSTPYNVFGTSNPNMIFTLSDDDKISSYQVSLNGGDSYGNPIKVESSQQTITYSLMTLLENDSQYKRHTIKFKVMDENYKDDSSTPNNFVYKTYYIAIDDGVPVITISTANNQFVNSVEILGNVSDKNGVKKITFTPKGCAENEVTPDDKGNFSYKLEEDLKGKSPIKVRAIDGIDSVTETEFVYRVDTTKPTVSVNSSVAGKVWNQTTSLEVQGTANDLAATGEDSSGVAKVRYAIGKGHSATEVDSNGWKDASGTDTWSAYVNIPSYSDGAYTLFVQVFDNTSNESDVQKFNITADSKSPVLTEGDSTDANSTRYSQSTLNLTGTVTDDNLIGLYYTYSFGENSVTEEPSISGDSNWVINKSDLADGTHIFKIVATDKAGNSSVITRNIIVDNTDPVITTNVSPQIMYNDGTGEKLTVNGTIDVNVRVTETNKLKGVYYTENTTLADDTEWSGVTGVTSFNETELSTGKTISVDTTRFADKSTLPLRIKAVDEAGNYSVVYVNPVINQKSDKPSLTPSNFVELKDENDENEKLAGWLGGNPTNVFSSSNPNMIFTLSDDDSVKEYSVKVGSGDFVKISEVNSTQKIVTYSLEDLIKNGNYDRHTITFRVKDVNCAENLSSTQNNFVDKTYYIAIDDGQPSLIINNANNQYVGKSFFINGSVTDKNGISSVIIKPLSGGEAYATLKEENGGLTKTAEGYSFKSLFTVPSTKDTIQILAIDSIGNESVKELTYLVDETKPRVLISNGEKAFIDGDSPTLRITGSAVDGDLGSNDNGRSGIDQVRLKIGSEISGVTDADSYLATGKVEDDGTLSWSYNLDFTGKAAGNYTVYAQSFDFAGNTSKQETITVYVDTDVPQINVTTENSPDATGIKNIGIRKDAFDITGTVSDNGGIASIIAKIQGVSENLEGNLEDSNWSFTVPNTVDNGKMTIIITATDNCGKTSQETLTVILDTVKPVITFANIENDKILPTKEYEVKGSIDDANGIAKVEYQLYAGDRQVTLDGSSVTNWITVENAKATFSLPLTNLQKNINYVLKLRATDTAGNITEDNANQRSFILNNDDPSISIISISPQVINGEESSVNGTIKVKATLSDTNRIVSAYYTYESSLTEESDWSGSGKSTPFTSDQISNGIEITVDTTKHTDKNNLPLRIKAIDEAGNYKVVPVAPYVNQDLDVPSIVPTNFKQVDSVEECGWKGSETINVFGTSTLNMIFTLSDDDSVKEYWVSKDGGEFKKEADVNSAQKVMSYSLESLKESYGGHSITFRVVDENYVDNSTTDKNYKEQTYYFVIDDGAPILTLDNANGQFVGSSFAIKGNVKDANGIDKISLSSVGGSGFATKELTLGNGLSENGDFSYAFTETSTKSDINIAVIDRIGNTSYGTLTYKLDGTKPIVTIANGVNAFVDADYPSLRIAGTATDGDRGGNDNGISGIDQVRLKIGSSITSVDDADSILAIGKIENGVMSWSSPLDFTGKLAGNYTVYIQAFDHAGNKSEEKTITVYVDTDVPQLSDNYTDNFVGVYNSAFVIEGTATDASGVKSVTAKIQGASNNLEGTYTETTDSSDANWLFEIPSDVGNGQLTILVTAKDGCGKSVQETFTATLDTEAPSVTFTDISDDDANNATIETSKTTDKPRVSVTYADSTSGVKNIDYTFYYYDAEQDKFVDYSLTDGNAKGAFTRDKSFSGTVVMKMAESTGSKGPFVFTDSDTDGIWYVKVSITDEAGNSAEYDSPYFYVDQHKPELEVTSPSQNVNLKKQNDALEVTGTTSDSYGGDIDKVVVKISHPSYNASQQAKFTKTFTKDGSNGTEILTKNGESYQFTYTWNGANSPFVYPDVYELLVSTYDVAGNETVRTPQKISCDNTAPTITFSRPYSYSVDAFGNVNEGIVVNSPIGDTSIKAKADDYSMAAIYYQIGGTVDIEATGSIGSSNYKITKLTVENGGVGTDTYGTSVTDVKLDGVNIALAGNWNRLTSANLDFDVEYNTLNMVNAGKTYHADGDKETIQTLDVHFVAVDTAGNINYCKYPLKVDTDTDKPTLLMLSPKTINDVANVGGTATISGTVNDDNAVHSVWMQVELVNGNYDGNDILSGFTALTYGITEPQVLVENIVDGKPTYSSESTTSYFADRTKWYKVNLGAENSTSTTWNMMLNKNGEFDIAELKDSGSLPNDDELKQTELLIKVKALDTKANDGLSISTDAKAGDSTEFRLIIDSGSPSIIINNIADFPAEGSYIGGNITFDLEFSDDQSITEWKLEAISTASGDNRSMLIASDEYSGSYEDGLGKTVTPDKIIVDTADIYAQCGNLIQFKISAKDNSKDPQSQTESPKESYLTFKYTIDNSAPDASLVSTIDSKSYYIDTESVMGDLTGAHRETIARGNHLRIMSNQAALTGKVFDEANGSGIDYVMLYFTKGNRLYNPSEENSSFEISNHLSVKDKDGNSVSPLSPVGSLKDVVRTSGTSNPYIVVDRAEGMLDSGANGDLDGYDENLKANGDWVVYIKSSNLPDGIYDIHYVVVDFAGNARYYSDTMLVQNHAPTINSIVLATDIDGDGQASIGNDDKGDEYQKFVTGEFTSTGFNVRNSKLKIKVNVTGGTGNLKYYLRYKTKTGEITTDKNNSGYSTGIFEVTDFLGDSATPVDYVVWVEDSVEQNLSLSSGETTIDMIMDNEDDVAPVAQFFELNTIAEDSKTGNNDRGSLYKGNGHIEPRGNSPFGNTDGKDPDVSGTIILRGEVFDNQRINYIALNLNGIETPIAQWSENSLKVSDDEIVNIVSKLGLDGHYVEWSYAWDTNSIVAENVNISVIVKDASGKTNTESSYDNKNNSPRTTENMYSRENWGYNKMTVDVVPYITAVYRNGSYNTNRAKSGAYPMLRGQVDNCIEGFNLGTDVSKISVVITENKDGSGYSFAMGSLTKWGTSTAFTVTSDSKDGYLSTVVNGIRSINNLNSNSHEYNRESNSYDSKTAYWTDDRYVRIWQNKSSDYFPGSTNPVYPAMSIGNTGDLYASFSNYSTASVYYSRYGGSGTGTVFKIYDPPEETDICVTGEDKLNIAFAGNYHNGGSNSWVSDASLSGGIYVYDSASTGKYNGYKFNKHELYYHNKMLQQFKNMRVKRKSSDRIIHLVYFDRITSSIHYSNSRGDSSRSSDSTKQTSTSAEYSWVNIDGGTDGDDYAYYFDGNSTYIEDSKGTYDRFEDTERCAGTGESAGLALTKSGYPVVVYFDASNKVLKLARALRENPKNSDTTWWVQDIKEAKDFLGVSVEAISCEIDSSGYLHIAFQNGKNQLIYIKSTNTSDNGSTRYTFTTPVIVAEGVSWVDLTLYGSTPYISFLSGANSYDGLNLAFFDKNIDTNFDGISDGTWECMVAPLAYKATSIRTCVEVHPQMTTSDWEAAIGFTPGDLYRVALYIGSGKGH